VCTRHLDTWPGYPGTDTAQSRITHGTFFNVAREEGLLADASSVHAGIRCKFTVRARLPHIQYSAH
jgi:agmatinase